MKPVEQIAQLEKELAASKEREAGLLKRVQELEALKKEQKPSKSRIMAEETLKLLRAGPVSMEQLAKLNPKYPSDCVFYVRSILKVAADRVKTPSGNVYMLAAAAQAFREEQQKQKIVAESAAKDAKEEVPPAPTQTSSTQFAHA